MVDTKQTKTIGEHYVAAELARRGWAPAFTRDGLERTDILAVKVDGAPRRMIEIQVKAARGPRFERISWPLGSSRRHLQFRKASTSSSSPSRLLSAKLHVASLFHVTISLPRHGSPTRTGARTRPPNPGLEMLALTARASHCKSSSATRVAGISSTQTSPQLPSCSPAHFARSLRIPAWGCRRGILGSTRCPNSHDSAAGPSLSTQPHHSQTTAARACHNQFSR